MECKSPCPSFLGKKIKIKDLKVEKLCLTGWLLLLAILLLGQVQNPVGLQILRSMQRSKVQNMEEFEPQKPTKAQFQTHGPKLFLFSHKTLGARYLEGILAMANMESEPKRRKIYQPPSRRIVASPTSKEERVDKPVPVAQIGTTNFRIQQAKHFAIAQAQQDGCTGNFRIFDSPFGNYFVPVVPTRKDLGA